MLRPLVTLLVGLVVLGGCGDDPGSGAGLRERLELRVFTEPEVFGDLDAIDCLQLESGEFEVIEVPWSGLVGSTCLLAAVRLRSDGLLYWISGPAFDIELRQPDFDDDPVRHSPATTEDRVQLGSFVMNVYDRDDPDFGEASAASWSGVIIVAPAEESVVVELQ